MNMIEAALRRMTPERGRATAHALPGDAFSSPWVGTAPAPALPEQPTMREAPRVTPLRQPRPFGPRMSGNLVRAAEPQAAPAETPLPEVPAMAPAFEGKVVTSPATALQSVEQYRKLAALLHQQGASALRVLMVTSAVAHEGKSLTAINLALTLACSYGRNVLLIDADLRRPSLEAAFGRRPSHGLHEHLLTGDPPHVTRLAQHLTLLSAGRVNPDPTGVLSSVRLKDLVTKVSADYDWVLIDTPPVALLPDAQLLIDMVDATLIVVDASDTPFALAQRAVDLIGRERVFGVVLNRVEPSAVSSAYADGYTHLA